MGKPTICIGENKAADQHRGNREADHRLCFRYTDSTIPFLIRSEISSFWPASVTVQTGLCHTWSVFSCTGLYLLVICNQVKFPSYLGVGNSRMKSIITFKSFIVRLLILSQKYELKWCSFIVFLQLYMYSMLPVHNDWVMYIIK